MPRTARHAPGGLVYHVLNRAVARLPLFEKPADYEAFEQVLLQALEKQPLRLLGYCLMPNHWHLVVWPRADDELSNFFRWLTHTHTMRWHAHHHTTGTGHLYQGRFKAFPIESDEHFLTVLRYVERNALRAGLVKQAEHWRWGSLWRRVQGGKALQLLSDGPLPLPTRWRRLVNEPQTESELESLRRCVARGSPYGSEEWTKRVIGQLGLESTVRPRGRPRRTNSAAEPG